jgi:hypothetical protein
MPISLPNGRWKPRQKVLPDDAVFTLRPCAGRGRIYRLPYLSGTDPGWIFAGGL